MKIEQSQVQLDASHQLDSETRQVSGLMAEGETAAFGEYFRQLLAAPANPADTATAGTQATVPVPLVRRLFEELLAALRDSLIKAGSGEVSPAPCQTEETVAAIEATARQAGGGASGRWVRLNLVQHQEQESTTVLAHGCVKTADGRELAFRLQCGMDREASVTQASWRTGSLTRLRDPLVLNFDGPLSALAGQQFAFDLNADGQAEQLPVLGAGHAYLVFDRNGDGRIGDGTELFGALSGAGFADLRALDQDGNGWLDEGDRAFRQLGVWSPDGAGQGAIADLATAGVGAISLSATASPFQIKDGQLRLQGMVRETGVWLSETGQAGSLQQVDFAA